MGESDETMETTTIVSSKAMGSREDAVALAVVGCGRLTETGYLPALADLPDVRLAALIDPDEVRRQTLAARACRDQGVVPSYPDLASAIEVSTTPGRLGPRIDGVILASPASAHVDDARIAAEAGLAVLVEKPPAPDLAGAKTIARLTPRPWVGFNRRFDPAVLALRERVAGHSGPVDMRAAIHYRRASWHAYGVDDDALEDLGPHLVDWVRWIGGRDIESVSTTRLTHDRAKVELTLSGEGGRATIAAAADRVHRERVRIRVDKGPKLSAARRGGLVAGVAGRFRRGSHPLVESLRAQTEAFAAVIRDRATPGSLGTADDGVAVMAVIDAARRSFATGSEVSLSELDAVGSTP